jgi:hypothetical protein
VTVLNRNLSPPRVVAPPTRSPCSDQPEISDARTGRLDLPVRPSGRRPEQAFRTFLADPFLQTQVPGAERWWSRWCRLACWPFPTDAPQRVAYPALAVESSVVGLTGGRTGEYALRFARYARAPLPTPCVGPAWPCPPSTTAAAPRERTRGRSCSVIGPRSRERPAGAEPLTR